jgi:polysaccharide biosynthesis protein PslH
VYIRYDKRNKALLNLIQEVSMKILFITSFLPKENAKQAGVNCTYNFIKMMKEKFECSIDLLCTLNTAELTEDMEDVKIITKNQYIIPITSQDKLVNVLRNISKPVLAAVRIDNRLKKKIRELSGRNNYDFVFIDYTQNSLYVNDINRFLPNAKVILIEQDVSFLGYERKYKASRNYLKKIFYYLEFKRLKKFELEIINKFNVVYTLNEKDSALLCSSNNIEILNPYISGWNYVPQKHETFNIMFWGAMNRKENEDAVMHFIENIWPLIEKKNTKFYIIGANPSEKIKNLVCDDIVVTGFVENPSDYFSVIDISVIPLRLGAGIKIKVLESMLNYIPVVTTAVGAEGIELLDGINGFVTDDNIQFANKVNLLKHDVQLRNTIKNNAFNTVSSKYSFLNNEEKLREALKL